MKCALGRKPRTDKVYLERMSQVIFRVGLSFKVVENKWPEIKKAFKNFDIQEVSKITDEDLEKMMKNQSLIRNYTKLNSVVENAFNATNVKEEFGSISKMIKHFSLMGEQKLIKEVAKRFSYLGKSTAVYFLRSVGEELPETMRAEIFK